MAQSYSERAPFNDWWYWSECLGKCFRAMESLYREHGEPERAAELGAIAAKLKETCNVPVTYMRNGLKTDEQKAEVKRLEEEAIGICAGMFRDILYNFAFISSAIQTFLGIVWSDLTWDEPPEEFDEFGNAKPKKKRSSGDTKILELFWGPQARPDEGIRSGRVADGGLPGILYNLLLAEKTSSTRQPTGHGKFMQAAANQDFLAVQQKHEKAGVQVNFKPPGGF